MLRKVSLFLLLFACSPGTDQQTAEGPSLRVEDLGKTYLRNQQLTPEGMFYDNADKGGSTSIRRVDGPNLKWKDKGYYQRNRELGQVFNVPKGKSYILDALVLRTGNSASAVLAGTAGFGLYFQLYRVDETPAINDNNTPVGTSSTHGFTRNHRADDYLTGITYTSLLVAEGGVFPDLPPTSQNGGQAGHLRYLRFDLQNEAEYTLKGGQRYAFIVGFTEPGPERGFTLGNHNLAADTLPPALRTDANGQAWWGLRREGNGEIPVRHPGLEAPPQDSAILAKLYDQALYGADHQVRLQPTTNGFPDVDTYRTLEFYLEVRQQDQR